MAELTISLKHQPAADELTCGVCNATFIPVEDSGSRVLDVKSGAQAFGFLMCGGCHSKWVHGAVVKIRSMPAATGA